MIFRIAIAAFLSWPWVAYAAKDGSVPLATSLSAERIPLPSMYGSLDLSVRPLDSMIEIHGKMQPRKLAARITHYAGAICPRTEAMGDGVVLRCRTSRIDAQFVSMPNQLYLDVRELRGVPYRDGDDGVVQVFYDPQRLGLGGACPGSTPAAQGECLYRDGKRPAAIEMFKAALQTHERDMAAVRLGDLMLESGEPSRAADWYQKTSDAGMWARVAQARICELMGQCLVEDAKLNLAFGTSNMPEPVRTDLELRHARVLAFLKRPGEAATLVRQRLLEAFTDRTRDPICDSGTPSEKLCRRLALAALRGDAKDHAAGLALMLSLPERDAGPFQAELEQAANSAAAGDIPGALDKMHERLHESRPNVFCDSKERFCRTLLLASLRNAKNEARKQATDLYLALPERDQGPFAGDLSYAAAQNLRALGAPLFAANLMASTTPSVDANHLDEHLLKTSELYLAAGDRAHADAVYEFARARATPLKAHAARWASVGRAIGRDVGHAKGKPLESIAADKEIRRARALVEKAHTFFTTEPKP